MHCDVTSQNSCSFIALLINHQMCLQKISFYIGGIRSDKRFLIQMAFYFYFFVEPVLEDLELPHRYRPENLQMLCDETG